MSQNESNEDFVAPRLAREIKNNFNDYQATLGALVVLGDVNGKWKNVGELGTQFAALANSPNMTNSTFSDWYKKAKAKMVPSRSVAVLIAQQLRIGVAATVSTGYADVCNADIIDPTQVHARIQHPLNSVHGQVSPQTNSTKGMHMPATPESIIRSTEKEWKPKKVAAYWGHRAGEAGGQSEPGDLVAYARGDLMTADRAAAFFDRDSGYKSHSDVVVAKRTNEIDVIGCNVGDTVAKKTLAIDEHGHIRDGRHCK